MAEKTATIELKDGKDLNSFNLSIDKIQIFLNPEEKKDKDKDKSEKKELEIPKKSKFIAIFLAFFLGRFGIHHLYLGRPTLCLVYLVFSRYEFMFFVGMAEAFIYFITDKESWYKDHGTEKIKKKY
ncbi:MAG: hypothetical protein K0Q49_436 [Haloplasmataceae bacterium]|nr:hypothetical protein [Haloplasmataceae bacterium]